MEPYKQIICDKKHQHVLFFNDLFVWLQHADAQNSSKTPLQEFGEDGFGTRGNCASLCHPTMHQGKHIIHILWSTLLNCHTIYLPSRFFLLSLQQPLFPLDSSVSSVNQQREQTVNSPLTLPLTSEHQVRLCLIVCGWERKRKKWKHVRDSGRRWLQITWRFGFIRSSHCCCEIVSAGKAMQECFPVIPIWAKSLNLSEKVPNSQLAISQSKE